VIAVWLCVAMAGDPEGSRLVEEAGMLSAKGRWEGVDRTYRRLLRDHPTQLDGELHRLGAVAAVQTGDLVLAGQRWGRVQPGDATHDEAVAALDRLASSTQLVALTARVGAELKAGTVAFDPVLRVAQERAAQEIMEQGFFVGALPTGPYTLDGEPLNVVTGQDWLVLP
jgi:hypothetical protein